MITVLYSPQASLRLHDYGINVSAESRRSEWVLEEVQPFRSVRVLEQTHDFGLKEAQRAHTQDYCHRLFLTGTSAEIAKAFELFDEEGQPHRYRPDLATRPLEDLLQDVLHNCHGTYQTCVEALRSQAAFFLGGGYHHAFSNKGAGFCILNDLVMASRRLQAERHLKTVWIIDVDAHKGDGTAEITKGDTSIVTLSLHMRDSWPLDQPALDKEGQPNPSFIPSDMDVTIAPGQEELYAEKLQSSLVQSFESQKARPDLALVVLGADPFEGDQLQSSQDLKLTQKQMLERDLIISRFLSENGVPQAYVMGGGYGPASPQIYSQFINHGYWD